MTRSLSVGGSQCLYMYVVYFCISVLKVPTHSQIVGSCCNFGGNSRGSPWKPATRLYQNVLFSPTLLHFLNLLRCCCFLVTKAKAITSFIRGLAWRLLGFWKDRWITVASLSCLQAAELAFQAMSFFASGLDKAPKPLKRALALINILACISFNLLTCLFPHVPV